jgi:hypothetical protein
MPQHLALDFFDEKGQVEASETQAGSWNAMRLDVRRYVLMVSPKNRD